MIYTTLITSGTLNRYFSDIDEQIEKMFSRLVKQIVEHEGVTEQFKASNQMACVGAVNNILNRAMGFVKVDLIYR